MFKTLAFKINYFKIRSLCYQHKEESASNANNKGFQLRRCDRGKVNRVLPSTKNWRAPFQLCGEFSFNRIIGVLLNFLVSGGPFSLETQKL